MDYYIKGDGKPLLFLHGFNMHPHVHKNYFDLLSLDNEVIAPCYNTGLNKPITLDNYIEKTNDFINYHGIDEYNVIGFSLGGAISMGIHDKEPTPEKIIGINPLLPVCYNFGGYVKRAGELLKNEIKTTDRENYQNKTTFGYTFFKNLFKSPLRSVLTINDISNYCIDDIFIEQPTQIILGTEDEFFKDCDLNKLKRHFSNLEIHQPKGINHNYDDAILDIWLWNKKFLLR